MKIKKAVQLSLFDLVEDKVLLSSETSFASLFQKELLKVKELIKALMKLVEECSN